MTTKTKDTVRKWTLDLGKVDYSGRGRKVNRVTLDVELRHKVNTVAPYLDIDLKPCTEYTELSICGNVWNAAGSDIVTGGQCVDTIRQLFPTGPVRGLVDIWSLHHLGGMKAGTRTQEAYLRDNPVTDRLDYYTKACAALEKANLLHVSGPGNPNYKYGSAWLVEHLPAEVEADVVRICEELTAKRTATAPEFDPQNFAQEHAIRIENVRVPENPNWHGKGSKEQRHFHVTLRHADNTRKPLTTYFSQGSAHTKAPTAMDVLNCLAQDAQSAGYTFEEWCSELGFDSDSREAEKTFRTVQKQSAELKKFLGDELYRALLDGISG